MMIFVSLCVGIFLVGIPFISWLSTWIFILRAKPATGITIDYESGLLMSMIFTSKVKPVRSQVVEFQTDDGQKIQFTEKVPEIAVLEWLSILRTITAVATKDGSAVAKSLQVPVLYNPANPKKARIKGFYYLHFWHLLFLVFGLAFFVVFLSGSVIFSAAMATQDSNFFMEIFNFFMQ